MPNDKLWKLPADTEVKYNRYYAVFDAGGKQLSNEFSTRDIPDAIALTLNRAGMVEGARTVIERLTHWLQKNDTGFHRETHTICGRDACKATVAGRKWLTAYDALGQEGKPG